MLHEIKTSKEEAALREAFEECLRKVKGKTFFEEFAKEKIHHSMQVVGAGNYIMKNERIFQHRDPEFLKLGKLVNLYHDIGRFKEIFLLSEDPSSRHDHGFYSYEILKEKGYSDWRLLLPVKQHGHLVDALDNDEEFQRLTSADLRREVRELYGLVKDADKIANLYLIKTDARIFKDLFFAHLSEEEKYAPVSEKVLQSMECKSLVTHGACNSFSDRLLQILCFAFEIYYRSSFDFINKHGLFEHILSVMRQFNPDAKLQRRIEDFIGGYITERYAELSA